jgi:ribosomal protein S27E
MGKPFSYNPKVWQRPTAAERSTFSMALTCPSCGNEQNFLVKTLQMHVVQLRDSRVEANEEGRPAVIEVLCDECETALNFAEFEEDVRNEMLLTLGAR